MRIRLRTKMLIMSFIVVSFSMVMSGWIMVYSISDAFEKELGERARAIARTVAQMSIIKENVGKPGGEIYIQPVAERTRVATNVDYIVIFDMNRIRYSHPTKELIGKQFVGGDEHASLSGQEYISKAQGTLGYSMRAFVPIMNEGGVKQVGVVVVGVLTPTFHALVAQYRNDILLSLVWGLLIGLLGSLLLAQNIKKQTLGLEPYEIAKMVEERSAVMQEMDMGIIALDENGNITFMNRLAKQYTQSDQKREKHVAEILPKSLASIASLMNNEESQQDKIINRTIVLYDKTYLISLCRIRVKGKLAGSFLTMIDRTEANRLAEELTGVKTLVDALRAQTHEYMNKLHSIAGLIQLERIEEALEIIIDETTEEENVIQFLKENISEHSVSGILLGKRSRARELGVHFSIDQESYLTQIVDGFTAGDIVTILGNLIENAFDSYSSHDRNKIVGCCIQCDEHHLSIMVRDEGKGIAKVDQDKIFLYGYTTKSKDGHGIGLALVKQIVDAHQGKIQVDSKLGEGTKITIDIERYVP
ncbi:sensor histidine kinase [Bacillus sp. MRMR6]|uniref:ATP-binding protein n=1 Tax=Bacillus sp. MRMR6 TaxID=1928617 RepID=UPI00095316C6|nr:sensor histidine kinase [Bacillus sp. MRMR6]OLS37301.1 histidine kinase [Bacillus sp. MRMR6]